MNLKSFKNYWIVWIAFFLIAGALISFCAPIKFLLTFAVDDGFVHLKIAINLAKGNGSTFDGFNPTNGYHPLWVMLLSFIGSLMQISTPVSVEMFYRVIFMVELVFCFLATVLIIKVFEPYAKTKNFTAAITCFVMLGFLFNYTEHYGMEVHLVMLLISGYLYTITQETSFSIKFPFIKGVLLSSLFLARTDYLFTYIPPILFAEYFLFPKQKKLKQVLIVAPLVLTVLLYYGYNYFTFGHFLTTAGYLKNAFPNLLFLKNVKLLIKSGRHLVRFMFILISLSLMGWYLVKERMQHNFFKKIDLTLFMLGVGGFIFCLMHLCLNAHGLQFRWYMGLPLFIASVIIIRIILNFNNFNLYLLCSINSILFILCCYNVYFYIHHIESMRWSCVYDYAIKIQEWTPKDAKIFQIDMSGIVGYFSERTIIDGDGLFNSFEFIDYVEQGKLGDYLQLNNIQYYSTYTFQEKIDSPGKKKYVDYRFNSYGGYNFEFAEDLLINRTHCNADYDFALFKFPWAKVKDRTNENRP